MTPPAAGAGADGCVTFGAGEGTFLFGAGRGGIGARGGSTGAWGPTGVFGRGTGGFWATSGFGDAGREDDTAKTITITARIPAAMTAGIDLEVDEFPRYRRGRRAEVRLAFTPLLSRTLANDTGKYVFCSEGNRP